jgi:hypothetical protein
LDFVHDRSAIVIVDQTVTIISIYLQGEGGFVDMMMMKIQVLREDSCQQHPIQPVEVQMAAMIVIHD